MNALKKIGEFIVSAGAVACALAGLWVICVAVINFREMPYPQWIAVLVIEAIFVCFAFTPAFMLLRGFKTKTWHWVVIGMAEVVVVAVALYAVLALIAISTTRPPG